MHLVKGMNGLPGRIKRHKLLLKLHRKGYSYRNIGKRLGGISRQRVHQLIWGLT